MPVEGAELLFIAAHPLCSPLKQHALDGFWIEESSPTGAQTWDSSCFGLSHEPCSRKMKPPGKPRDVYDGVCIFHASILPRHGVRQLVRQV